MGKIKGLFEQHTAEKIRNDYRADAERRSEEHRAAAEHHKALADMYEARMVRLTQVAPK